MLQWITQQPTFNTNADNSYPTICSNGPDIFVSYSTYGTVSGGTNTNAGGSSDIVVMKMSPINGSVTWITQQPTFNTHTFDTDPTICSNGTDIFVSYQTSGTVSGGTNAGTSDIVVMKISEFNGSVTWITQQPTFNTNTWDYNPTICSNGTDIFVSYQTSGTVSGGMNASSGDIVVMKISGLDVVCFTGYVKITMADKSTKLLKDVNPNDEILEDKKTSKTNKVVRVYKKMCDKVKGWKIGKGLIGNEEDMICTNHPIWCNNDENRILPEDIKGVEEIEINVEIFDIQYEDEGTFYANGVKVDSLPPYNEVQSDQ